MEDTDIPFFQVPASGQTIILETGEIIRGWIVASGFEEVAKRLGCLNQADLARQLEVIRTSLQQYLAWNSVSASKED